jgi:hypothetical protein
MKYQKIIWRAFLPKTNCFSHPPRAYPPVIPAGPPALPSRLTRQPHHAAHVSASAHRRNPHGSRMRRHHGPAASATHRGHPRSHPHYALPTAVTTHPGRARRSPCRWPVPHVMSMAPTSCLPWVVASLIVVVRAGDLRGCPRAAGEGTPPLGRRTCPRRLAGLRCCGFSLRPARRASTELHQGGINKAPLPSPNGFGGSVAGRLPVCRQLLSLPHRVAGPVARPSIDC